MAAREARTDPVVSAPVSAPDAPVAGEGAQAPPHSVTLSDGRVAVLKENSAYEARQARRAILRMGISPQIDSADFVAAMAVFSIASLDGEAFTPPTTEVKYNAFLMDGLTESDMYRLVGVYVDLIGEDNPADADFRR